jgi:hypothetical protein
VLGLVLIAALVNIEIHVPDPWSNAWIATVIEGVPVFAVTTVATMTPSAVRV